MSKVTYPKLDFSFKSNLSANLNSEEIKHDKFDMCPRKAHGLDEFPATFYQKSWSYVRDSICGYIYKMWNDPSHNQKVNSTEICLIPKVPHPTQVQ
ncbi:unnamed protein product [Lathyrus sativus]|nr:unnamed protein product [Lathyrus sativus]